MNTTYYWTLFSISYQTILCIMFSWLTLGCKLSPNSNDLYEVTLMKLLYLYDPVACGRIYFYNHSIVFDAEKTFSMVVWPVKNEAAAAFRVQLQVWLLLHILWLTFGLMTAFLKQKSYSFYVSVMPFTLTGLALLVIDLIYGTMFLIQLPLTSTENQILTALNANKHNLKRIIKPLRISEQLDMEVQEEDTSWISLLFAFMSYRGVVQWIANFWIVKDNLFLAIAERRRIAEFEKPRRETRRSVHS